MKKNINYLLLGIFIVLGIILLLIVGKKEDKNVNISITEKYTLVKDYSEFYTIEGCVNKLLNYISTDNITNINKILVNDNHLNEYIDKYKNKNISVDIKEMYYQNTTYYLKGNIYEEILNGINKLDESYLVVRLNNSRELFNIELINKNEYYGVVNGK